MGNRVLLSIVVALMVGSGGAAAQAQETVQPLPSGQVATGRDRDIAVAPSAPASRAEPVPPLRLDPPSATRSSADTPSLREPAAMQMVLGVVIGIATSIAAIQTYSDTRGNVWYTGAVVLGGTLATGAIVCAVGQLSPTRRGGCRGSLVGALAGVVGAVPGLVLLHFVASSPCSGEGEGCLNGRFLGGIASLATATVGYTLGTAFGAQLGWTMGAVSRAPAPMAATASLLSVQF